MSGPKSECSFTYGDGIKELCNVISSREADPFPTALDPSIDPMISSRWLCAVPYVKALRLHQWSKNLLVLLPVVAAHNLTAKVWIAALLAFVSFSFVASSAYLLNDLLDFAADRAHPRKRNRPLASGALPARTQ